DRSLLWRHYTSHLETYQLVLCDRQRGLISAPVRPARPRFRRRTTAPAPTPAPQPGTPPSTSRRPAHPGTRVPTRGSAHPPPSRCQTPSALPSPAPARQRRAAPPSGRLAPRSAAAPCTAAAGTSPCPCP